MWSTYFDDAVGEVERRLHAATGRARNVTARDSFSFLHLPLVAGIVLLALGSRRRSGAWRNPLKLVPAMALCGGVALYFLADVAFRWRGLGGRIDRQRLVAAGACLALVPLATALPAWAALVCVA